MKRFLLSCSCLFYVICNYSCKSFLTTKLSQKDSLAIFDTLLNKRFKNMSFVVDKPDENKSIASRQVLVEKAKEMIKNYQSNRIPQMIWYDQDGNKQNINALEIDNSVITMIRNNADVNGLRLYLGKRTEDNRYTLILLPYDATGKNIISDATTFEWHKPCPPCDAATTQQIKMDAETFGQ